MLQPAPFSAATISFPSLPYINSRRSLARSRRTRRAVHCRFQMSKRYLPQQMNIKRCVCALLCAARSSLFFYFASANRDFECIKTMFYVFQFRASRQAPASFLLISRRARATLKTRSSANSSQTSCWVPKLVAPPSASPVWLFVASKLARAQFVAVLFYGTTLDIKKLLCKSSYLRCEYKNHKVSNLTLNS